MILEHFKECKHLKINKKRKDKWYIRLIIWYDKKKNIYNKNEIYIDGVFLSLEYPKSKYHHFFYKKKKN